MTHILPANQYHARLIDCPDCDNGRVYDFGYGHTAHTCETCSGDCEIDASCEECGKITALNDELTCERCHDASNLPAHDFWKKYGFVEPLTEVRGDPLLKRKAA